MHRVRAVREIDTFRFKIDAVEEMLGLKNIGAHKVGHFQEC